MPDPIDKPMPGSKFRSMLHETRATAQQRVPHALGGGKGGRIDDICEFAATTHVILLNKIKLIASRRKAGGYPMWTIVRKALDTTEDEAKWLCRIFDHDPDTTVRDREEK